MLRPLLVALLAIALGGCAAIRELLRDPEDVVTPTVRPDPLYEELVGHYIELCAVSQYRPIRGAVGGIPGHAVLYLKGACRDESATYPRLRPCRRAATRRSDPEHGAGVSVNRRFRNVNWVATPGKALFYDGDLGTYDLLDEAHWQRTLDRALELGIYDGVELHPEDKASEPPALRDFVAAHSLGTDFALRFGRTVFCARLVLRKEMLLRAMLFLNDLNDEYYHGLADYQWSGYSDNCVHTLHNALAAAGVWKPKSVQVTKLRQFFNLAVPANTFVELAFLTNEYPIEDFRRIHRDPLRWKLLTEQRWLPAGPGGLVKTLPVHQRNELYDTRMRIFVLPGLLRDDTTKRAQRVFSDGRYLQLDANLRYFLDRYRKILERGEQPSGLSRLFWSRKEREAYPVYRRHIEWARDDALRALQRLAELDAERQRSDAP